MQEREGLTTGKKITILSLLSVIAVLLLVVAIMLPSGGTSFKRKTVNSRTVLIFMAGNNLESDSAIATSDLASIDPSLVDLEHTKVLLYTGGTKIWHNDYISSDEDAIYELTANGFNKLQKFTKSNLGNEAALAQFLNYGYNYGKTDAYDLIFWDHGLGALGSISDENSGDFLDLTEIRTAFERSPFNKNNKLEVVLFRTCLNATMEVASTLSPYADYMVASEEVTYGKTGHSVMNFLNDVSIQDDATAFGQAFITSYQNQMNEIDVYGKVSSTYSLIDLSKVDTLNNMLDDFFSTVNSKANYSELARIRSNMNQFGETDKIGESDYDTVDLYNLVGELSDYDSRGASKIQNYIENDLILYNWSSKQVGNGISVYFPFTGSSTAKQYHMSIYNKYNISSNYRKFVTNFYTNQNSSSSRFEFKLADNEVKQKGNEFKLKLTEEQQKNFASASYIIFEKNDDGTFTTIYIGRDGELDKNGYVTTKISNNIIKVVDDNDGSSATPIVWQSTTSNKDYREYLIPVTLQKMTEDGFPWPYNATVHLKVDKKNKVHLGEVVLVDKDEDFLKANGTLVDLKDYKYTDYFMFRYKILDENGNYTDNWESSDSMYGFEVYNDKFHYEVTSLDKSGDYYCVFVIKDLQNNGYYSNLISIK